MTKEQILEKWCNKCLSPGEKTFLDIDSDIIDGSLVPVWRAMEEYADIELSKYLRNLELENDLRADEEWIQGDNLLGG
jgi:hypothetical protein